MNINIARDLAIKKVEEFSKAANDKFEILFELTEERKDGWIFFYNTSDFVTSGNLVDGLAGNTPIFISKEGDVLEIPSHLNWRDWVFQK